MRRLVVLAVVVSSVLSVPLAEARAASARAAAPRLPDMAAAVGAPLEDVAGVADAGAVYVFRKGGDPPNIDLDVEDVSVITRAALGGTPTPKDRFGTAVALTDTFRRGTEVIIGAPGADHGAGRVYLVHVDVDTGQFDLDDAVVLRQGHGGVPGTAEPGDGFGASLQVVYAGGLEPWLAIGAPGEDVHDVIDAGAVTGLELGTHTDSAKVFYQGGLLPGRAEPGDRFGSSLAQFAYGVVAGAPHEDVWQVPDAGGVTSFDLYGRVPPVAYRQGLDGVPGPPESGDRFGAAMTGLDLGGAAVGVPGEDIGSIRDAGTMIELAAPGVSYVTTQLWYQGHHGIKGTPERGDRFGAALTMGVRGLVVGVPGEDVDGVADAGAIHFLPFVTDSNRVFTVDHDALVDEGSPGVPGAPEAGDRFGASTGAAEFRVLVGVPNEGVGTASRAGAIVDITFDDDVLVTDPPTREITSATIGSSPQTGARFGLAL